MKLLVLTQKVDKNDDVLGFFHGWLKALAGRFQQITVICLQKGRYDLPANVRVFSLGKEKKVSRWQYLVNFYRLIWRTRKDYDAVFVHMNDGYVILGGLLWKIWGKKIYLWRNHIKGAWRARVAVWLSHQVFSTSPYSFIARYRKNRLMPAGIDVDLFTRDKSIAREEKSIFYLGRISPVKNIQTLIDAFEILKNNQVDFHGYIFGDPPQRDAEYFESLKKSVAEKGLADLVAFGKGVPNWQAPAICNQYEISVNLTNSGSFDKTILESMACENLQLLSNRSFKDKIADDFIFNELDAKDLAEKAKRLLARSSDWKVEAAKKLRSYVVENHSLDKLAEELFESFNKN